MSLASFAADIKSFRVIIKDRFTTYEETLPTQIATMINEQLRVLWDDIDAHTVALEERIRAVEDWPASVGTDDTMEEGL